MANGFTFESPLNKLLDETIPRFISQQLDRQEREKVREQARQDRQDDINRQQENMLRQEKLNKERFEKQFQATERMNQWERTKEREDIRLKEEAIVENKRQIAKQETRADEQMLYNSFIDGDNLQAIIDKVDVDEDGNYTSNMFSNPILNRMIVGKANDAQKEINNNKAFVESLSKFDVKLQNLFGDRINQKGMLPKANEIVFNYLLQETKDQDAQKAKQLSTVISFYGETQKRLKSEKDTLNEMLTAGVASEEDIVAQRNTIATIEESILNYNKRIKGIINNMPSYEPTVEGTDSESNGIEEVVDKNIGSNPFNAIDITDNPEAAENASPGQFVSMDNKIYLKDDDGKFEPYNISPEASERPDLTAVQRLSQTSKSDKDSNLASKGINFLTSGFPLAGFSANPKGSLTTARDVLSETPRIQEQFGTGKGGVLTLGGSPKEQVQAVRVVENNSDNAIKDLAKSRRLAVAGKESEEEYQEKRNLKNLEVQNLISNAYEAYLNEETTDRVKVRLKKFLQKMKDTQKKPTFTGIAGGSGKVKFRWTGDRNLFNQDTIDLLNEIQI